MEGLSSCLPSCARREEQEREIAYTSGGAHGKASGETGGCLQGLMEIKGIPECHRGVRAMRREGLHALPWNIGVLAGSYM